MNYYHQKFYEKHIEEIIDMVLDNGYKGIEIDYEGMKENLELWSLFVDFLENLQIEADKENLKLRVLLEPNFPLDSIILPEGPEYTIMCYNLHGTGTKPGPKADKNFILNMVEKWKNYQEKLALPWLLEDLSFMRIR